METINHEYYVSPEIAELLEKAGFDWEDYSVAHNIDEQFHWEIPLHIAQRWLREKWDLIITIEYNYYKNTFICKVYSKAECLSILFDFLTYEAALESSIKKTLEIILEK